MGVSLRCARVGVLRAALSLRCFANATHCLRTLRMPHASRYQTNTNYTKLNLVST
ncbi:MAG: hypothetical protein RML94_11555 [Bacteroidia bacterium]|nr:hypothetical protein [Bacteroidia bacterium]